MEPAKFDPTSHTLTDDLKAHLKKLVPEAFTENAIDFDRLKSVLGEMVDGGQERYSFTWPGKTQAIRAAQTPSIGTLVPDKSASEDWDTTQNLYLEGDNLEILKLLQKSYTGKVKMIYIDPPYNTGKDFVYPDNYGEGLKTYLEYTGQVDGEGKKVTTNTETDGRYHSKWLNMMYPRLMLARNLLKDDGVICISIDDHEQANLKKICDEVFGPENLIATLPVVMNLKGNPDNFGFSDTHEYALVYGKNKIATSLYEFILDEERIADEWEEDEFGPYKKADTLRRTGQDASRERRHNGWFPVFITEDNIVYSTENDSPRSVSHVALWPKNDEGDELSWTWSKKKINEEPHNLIVTRTRDGGYNIYKKQRPDLDDVPTTKPKTIFYKPEYSTSTATTQLKVLMGKKFFDGPKPVPFIKDLITIATKDSDLVIDFFSGSGTTAHALMQLNAEDGGSRMFILSQLQEPTPEDSEARKAGYHNIAELGRERIKRAGAKIKTDYAERLVERETPLDTGFRTYRLTTSTFNTWDTTSDDDIQAKLLSAKSLIKADASTEDVLAELILKSGYGLSEVVTVTEVDGVKVYSVAGGELMIVLEGAVTDASVRAVADLSPKRFIAREDAFPDDASLTNAAQIMKDKGIDFRVL